MAAFLYGPNGPNASPWKMGFGHRLELEVAQIQHQPMEEWTAVDHMMKSSLLIACLVKFPIKKLNHAIRW